MNEHDEESVDENVGEVTLFDEDECQRTLKGDDYMAKGTVIKLCNIRMELIVKKYSM